MSVRAACLTERGTARPSPLRPRTRPLAPQPASVIPWQRAGPRVLFALGTARSSAALARELLRPSGAHVLDRRFVRAQAVPQLRVGDAGANERLRARSAIVTFASLGAISARSRRGLGLISARSRRLDELEHRVAVRELRVYDEDDHERHERVGALR